MKKYEIAYQFLGLISVEAESADEAQLKFDQQHAIDLARHALDSLEVLEVTEEKPLLPEVSNDLVRI